jgi:hypothetical protein
MYIGKIILAKMSATATDFVLALAKLGDMTQIEMILSVSHHPRWSRQVHYAGFCYAECHDASSANLIFVHEVKLSLYWA